MNINPNFARYKRFASARAFSVEASALAVPDCSLADHSDVLDGLSVCLEDPMAGCAEKASSQSDGGNENQTASDF